MGVSRIFFSKQNRLNKIWDQKFASGILPSKSDIFATKDIDRTEDPAQN